MSEIVSKLTSGRLLARNTVWNFAGQAVPLLVAVFAIPVLIRELGTDRFGVLTLAWAVIGYFSLFDLGLGRALTYLVSEKFGTNKEDEVSSIVGTGLVLMSVLGIVGASILAATSPLLIRDILKIPFSLRDETLLSFYLMAVAVPVVIITTGLRGILEAKQRFELVNAVRIPLGIFTFAGPLLALLFSRTLYAVISTLVLARSLACGVYLVLALHAYPELRWCFRLQGAVVKELLGFGAWMTVSNLISPLMIYLDRFIIGSIISVSAVAYYCTPFDVVTKLLMIPAVLTQVLFPAFSISFVHELHRTRHLFQVSQKYIFLALFPLTIMIVLFAKDGLAIWLGYDFSSKSFRVAQIIAIGVLFNGLAHIPFALVQAAKRPDITAKLHIFELPLYVAFLWWLVRDYGINGAALAWLLRVTFDALALSALSCKLLVRGKNEPN